MCVGAWVHTDGGDSLVLKKLPFFVVHARTAKNTHNTLTDPTNPQSKPTLSPTPRRGTGWRAVTRNEHARRSERSEPVSVVTCWAIYGGTYIPIAVCVMRAVRVSTNWTDGAEAVSTKELAPYDM